MAAAGDVTPAGDAADAPDDTSPQRWDKSRVEIFSDGVFAIAITLLVLDISVEPSEFGNLRHALVNEWPAYLAYVTSFLTVGSVWIAHHNLFSRLRFIDPTLLRLNLLLLMTAAFLPFPTSVLAQALHHGGTAERTAVVFYGIAAVLIELVLRAAQRYAASRPELQEDPSAHLLEGVPARPHVTGWRAWVSTMLYAVAILFGVFVFPKVAVIGYLVVGIRSVFVTGSEGRLSLDFGWLVPKRWRTRS
ncbi:MAG TPA: TMEM175 family protein [Solirubrobacteraceae bacterium]|nr:TMEM175 family protein [Solirubrobacteraceae bacterium]